jgi:hypothetical protein
MIHKILFPVIIISFLSFSACKSKTKDSSNTNTKTENTSVVEAVENINKFAEAAEASKVRIEELKKLPPISNEVLKSFFKEEANEIKRSSFSVQSNQGYSIGEATYKKNDSTEYKVSIYDCVGEMGSGFYSLISLSKLNMETEDENGYEKTIDFMDTKAMKSYKKYNEQYQLSYFAANRFWVQMEGTHITYEDLQNFIADLDLSKLSSLK